MSSLPDTSRPPRVPLLDDLQWRGLIAQSTEPDALAVALAQPLTLYAGFDPTAASLHAGNLVPLLTLRRFQLAGHRPIALAGGATGMVGDPSGRSSERVLQTPDVVEANLTRIRRQLEQFLDFAPGPSAAILVDNIDWTASMSVLDFLRDVGKHFPVNAMLDKEAVRTRLAAGGITFTEFSYMLLQAHDYLQLFRRFECRLQIGGSDQWGNITAGLDLIRRVTGQSAHGLTVPLVTTASGEKFGKSTGGGRLWLDPALTTPYAFYQYFVNADDRDVGTYLRLFTYLPREEIEALDAATQERPQARQAQRRLAAELTTLVHGAAECRKVEAASAALFGRGALEELDEATLAAALAEVPTAEVKGGADTSLPPVVDLLAETGLCSSRSDARRTVGQGGAYVNNRKVSGEDETPRPEDLLHGRFLVLRRGRRSVAGVRVISQ